jgi:hypothetical protein
LGSSWTAFEDDVLYADARDSLLAEELEQKMLSRELIGKTKEMMSEGLKGFIGRPMTAHMLEEAKGMLERTVMKMIPESPVRPTVTVDVDEEGQLNVFVEFGVTCRTR